MSVESVFAIFSLVIFNSPGNCRGLFDAVKSGQYGGFDVYLVKQLSSGKMDPKVQEKLGELLSQTSQMLRYLSAKSGTDMSMQHHNKIKQMKKEWDPFYSTDRM